MADQKVTVVRQRHRMHCKGHFSNAWSTWMNKYRIVASLTTEGDHWSVVKRSPKKHLNKNSFLLCSRFQRVAPHFFFVQVKGGHEEGIQGEKVASQVAGMMRFFDFRTDRMSIM